MIFKERQSDDEKINVSITIDKNLQDNLNEVKRNKKYRKLSPKINDLLWIWINKIFREDNQE